MKVAFVCLGSGPLFDPAIRTAVGGMEIRAWLLARGLARLRSHEVHFLTAGPVRTAAPAQDGIALWAYDPRCENRRDDWRRRLYRFNRSADCFARRKNRFPWFEVRRPERAALWLALRKLRLTSPDTVAEECADALFPKRIYARIGADRFLCFGVSWLAAEVVSSCRRLGRRSMLLLASDGDLDAAYRPESVSRNAYLSPERLCHYALANADGIVAQTRRQQQLLKERFGREAALLRSPIELEDAPAPLERPPGAGYALWIGRAETFDKRADLALRLAQSCPEIPFLWVMVRKGPEDYYSQIQDRLPANVRVVEQVPYEELPGLFRGARVLVNTSAREGFPNTFLQAGKYFVPVVSLEVDPDGFLQAQECGLVAGGSPERQAELLRRVWNEPEPAARLARNLHAQVRREHGLEGRARELAALLEAAATHPCAV
jgi:glycosyltransferase involved in cell wall biosynthesis